jgi:hypothetical protein
VQLYKLFVSMGAAEADLLPHESFSDSIALAAMFDAPGPHHSPAVATFIRSADRMYRENTGAWCIAEVLSDDWLSALAKAFAAHPHLAHVPQQSYFDEVLVGHVEIRHMLETVSMTEHVLAARPQLLPAVTANMRAMAELIDSLWTDLQQLTQEHICQLAVSK